MVENRTNTEKAINGISSQTLVTIVLGLIEIGAFSIMSRLLTQEDFGYYAAVVAITTVFSSLSEAGIGSAIIQRKQLSCEFIDNAFTLCFATGGSVSILLFIIAGFLARLFGNDSLTLAIRLMAISLVLNSIASLFRSILHRDLKFYTIGFVNLLSLIITTVVAIALAYSGFGFYAILAKAILASILSVTLFGYFSHCKFKFAWNSQLMHEILHFSGWLTLAGIFNNLSLQIDRLLMTKLLGIVTLGAYNRPKEFITQISTKLNSIFDSALFPVLSSIQDDRFALQRSYIRTLYCLNYFSSILCLCFIVNSGLIIRVFFGEEWLNIRTVFQLLSIVLLFNVDARLEDCYLRSLGETRVQLIFRVCEFILQVIGVYIGSKYGILEITILTVVINLLFVIIKLLYINSRIEIGNYEVFGVILKGWLPFIYVLPMYLMTKDYFPTSIMGDILMFICFASIIIFLFFIGIRIFGIQYKTNILSIINILIYRKSS